MEKRIVVGQGLPGARGTNHELAARLLLPGVDFEMHHREGFADVYDALVEKDTCVVAAFDTTGSNVVRDSWKELTNRRGLWVERVVRMGVVHDLIGTQPLTLAQLQDAGSQVRIRSHMNALAQCEEWLERNLPEAEKLDGKDTAGSVATIVHGTQDPYNLAIAGPQTLQFYPGAISLAHGVQGADNITEFALLSSKRKAIDLTEDTEKETLLIVTQNSEDCAGDLFDGLAPLKEEGVNLTSLHSEQMRGGGIRRRFRFVIRATGVVGKMLHMEETPLDRALEGISRNGHAVRVLGSYTIFNASSQDTA
ncbi:MAG: prephenate dehydratase domain-containing protein [Candidatus Saccharimonadales bacterium]